MSTPTRTRYALLVIVAVVLAAVVLLVRLPGRGAASSPLSTATTLPVAVRSTGTPRSLDPEAAVARLDVLLAAHPDEYLAAAVLDTTTGKLALSSNARRGFASASLAKLITVVDILHRVEAGEISLSNRQRELLVRALCLSDDRAMDTLWAEFGGPRTIAEMVTLADLRDTRPPADPRWWGHTVISARDMIAVYHYIASALTPADRDTVMGALAAAPDTASDGFDQAFGLMRPPRAVGAATKQGWMVDNGSLFLHSAGRVGPWVIALLSERSAQVGYERGRAELSESATVLLAELAGRPVS